MAAALPTHRMDYGSRSIICLSKEYKRQIRESRLLWNVVYVFTEPKCVAIVSRPQSWLMKTVAKKRSARICNKFSRPRAKKKAKSYKILCFHHHLKIRPHRESPHPAHRLGCAGDDFSSFRSYWERKRSGRTRTGRTTATYTDTHKILEERRTMQKKKQLGGRLTRSHWISWLCANAMLLLLLLDGGGASRRCLTLLHFGRLICSRKFQ